MTEAELHLMRVRIAEGRMTANDGRALLAEIERLERELAEAHGIIDGLKDGLYDRITPPTHRT